jgi:hypothetical protein
MKSALVLVILVLSTLITGSSAEAQRGQPVELVACGSHPNVQVFCGIQGPEDLEATPDGRHLIVSQFSMSGSAGGLALFDPVDGVFIPMSITSDRRTGWGDLSCPGPMADPIAAHGTSLGLHPDGNLALYVVNHGGRETIEMFELRETGTSWELVWHGCVVASADYNDVAILPDGGYVATRPTALQEEGGNLFDGGPSGNVARWTPGAGETVLRGTEAGFPNGVVADPEGEYIYIAAWTGRGLRKYDLEAMSEVAAIDLDFMPDNLTWTPDGQLLAAGIQSLGGLGGFSVTEVNPETMTTQSIYESVGNPVPIAGVSVALETDDGIYVGAFQGDRLIRVNP